MLTLVERLYHGVPTGDRNEYSYDTENRLNNVVKYLDGELKTTIHINKYDGNKIIEISQNDGLYNVISKFTWTGDNVSHIDVEGTLDGDPFTNTIDYTYDNKTNPYNSNYYFQFDFRSPEMLGNANNILTQKLVSVQGTNDAVESIHNTTYEYSGDLPVVSKETEKIENELMRITNTFTHYFEY